MFNDVKVLTIDDVDSFDLDNYLRRLVVLREIAEYAYGEMRKTDWIEAIKSKKLRRNLAQMCNLIKPYQQPALLQKNGYH